jgi:hypothetical protein
MTCGYEFNTLSFSLYCPFNLDLQRQEQTLCLSSLLSWSYHPPSSPLRNWTFSVLVIWMEPHLPVSRTPQPASAPPTLSRHPHQNSRHRIYPVQCQLVVDRPSYRKRLLFKESNDELRMLFASTIHVGFIPSALSILFLSEEGCVALTRETYRSWYRKTHTQ